ncbi:MAG: efflux RND transporter periplasmic adaptor subunit [Chloroflexota bacterium]
MHRRPPAPAILLLVIAVIAGIYYGFSALNDDGNGRLAASGSIEATMVNVSPEMSGKVAEVLVEEGQAVKAGDPLLRLDGSLLSAQRAVASAAVDAAQTALTSAQVKYNQTLQAALSIQQGQRATDWRFSAPDEFNQPLWYFAQPEQIAAAQAEVEAAQAALDAAQANLQKVIADLNNADYVTAETQLAEARAAFTVADSVKVQSEYAAEAGGLRDAAYDYYNATLDELRAAQDAYNAMLNTKAADDVAYARGQVIVAQQRFDTAHARLLALQTGAESPSVITAMKAVEQAETALAQAQASLSLLDTQLEKLTVYAPMDGVVLTRNVEPGEFVQPGAIALTMGDLSNLTITVYVPATRYGQINLGQQATVTVDSFPGQTFTAEVVHISDQAEYTPRNVQTVEGRSSTVYAIRLKVTDSEGRLKIGMPADVDFSE